MIPVSTFLTVWSNSYLKIYNIDWIIGLQARISTIINEWSLQRLQVRHYELGSKQWYQYQHSWHSEVTYFVKSRILNEWSQQWSQYQHSWMREVTYFLKSRIFNEWSQQWSQHTDSLRNRAILLNFYNKEWVRRLPAQITTIMNEWCLQWLQDYHFEWVE